MIYYIFFLCLSIFFADSSASSRNKSRMTWEKPNRFIQSIFIARCVTLENYFTKINDIPQIILISLLRSTRLAIYILVPYLSAYFITIYLYYNIPFKRRKNIYIALKIFFLLLELNPINWLVPIDVCHDGETASSPTPIRHYLSICSLTPPPRSNVRLFSVIFLIIIATIYCFLWM